MRRRPGVEGFTPLGLTRGTQQSIDTAADIARPGSTIGIVGVPHGEIPFNPTFFRNIAWAGGPAPSRLYESVGGG